MSQIFRYTVPVDDQPHTIALSGDGKVLHVAARSVVAVEFWAIQHDPDVPTIEREFIVVGTGHSYPSEWTYVGTALTESMLSGLLVWHLMEIT